MQTKTKSIAEYLERIRGALRERFPGIRIGVAKRRPHEPNVLREFSYYVYFKLPDPLADWYEVIEFISN